MARPSKPVIVLEQERVGHRTKAELNSRKEYEQSLASGVVLREFPKTRENPRAHKEFVRVNKLLKNIKKNDALYQGIINRYCQLVAECEEFEEKRERFMQNMDDMENNPEIEINADYYKSLALMQSTIINCDKQVMQKRKMLLDIEKECVMTIAAALRSIPKNDNDKDEDDPMANLLTLREA